MRWMILSGVLLLAACQTTADKPAEPEPNADDRIACEARGGQYGQAGLLQSWVCIEPTSDAGKSCTTSSDCTGMCMADTMSCSAKSPMFGCYSIIEDGQRVELCID